MDGDRPQHWADLGAGSGTFTQALARLLSQGSVIHAIDKDAKALAQIPYVSGRDILKVTGDFVELLETLPPLDGVLMANALHYVKDQRQLLRKVFGRLVPGGRMLIVEYDTETANPWVPFPVSFATLQRVVAGEALSVELLAQAPSRYQRGGMYTALVARGGKA